MKQKPKYMFTITKHRTDEKRKHGPFTLVEAVEYFGYSLETGASYQHEEGNSKINTNPKNIDSLVRNLNRAIDNAAANGYGGKSYSAVLVEPEDA